MTDDPSAYVDIIRHRAMGPRKRELQNMQPKVVKIKCFGAPKIEDFHLKSLGISERTPERSPNLKMHSGMESPAWGGPERSGRTRTAKDPLKIPLRAGTEGPDPSEGPLAGQNGGAGPQCAKALLYTRTPRVLRSIRNLGLRALGP